MDARRSPVLESCDGAAHDAHTRVWTAVIAIEVALASAAAAVFAHGFNNTIGLVAFFLVGPTTGLW